MITWAPIESSVQHRAGILIYGITLTLTSFISSSYHALKQPVIKGILIPLWSCLHLLINCWNIQTYINHSSQQGRRNFTAYNYLVRRHRWHYTQSLLCRTFSMVLYKQLPCNGLDIIVLYRWPFPCFGNTGIFIIDTGISSLQHRLSFLCP